MPKAINICCRTAKDITYLGDNEVLISINNPFEPLHPLKLDRNSAKILTLQFPDICAPLEHKGQIYSPMDEKAALKILDFINRNKGKNFYVHCTAGVSRSSAICLYLNLFHGYELKKDFWRFSNPNKWVLGQLIVTRHCPPMFGDEIR